MEGLETVELLLIVISILLALYTVYIFFDQKKNMRFFGPKSKAIPLVALIVIALGVGNYFYQGQQVKDLGACVVLVMFGIIMMISRNGIGEAGLYVEGIRVSWKQISKVRLEQSSEGIQLYYVRKKVEKNLLLTDTTYEQVESYIKKMRKLYHFGK